MRLLVTAGPTREAIDPVRFISNPSTGKMGYAVAERALARGHEVVLVSGPVAVPAPAGVEVVPVVSAADMLCAVRDRLAGCDALVMAAAVADWRPRRASARKLKKREMSGTLELERTTDILKALQGGKGRRVDVGFAAETHDALNEGRRKLLAKGLDLIVVNDVTEPGAGFGVDTNRCTFVGADGSTRELPLVSKREVAEALVVVIERLVACAADGSR